jgi:hypothetical protein
MYKNLLGVGFTCLSKYAYKSKVALIIEIIGGPYSDEGQLDENPSIIY